MIEKIVREQSKALFKTEKGFCEDQGYVQKDFSKKKRVMQGYIDKVNAFLFPLKKKVEVVDLNIERQEDSMKAIKEILYKHTDIYHGRHRINEVDYEEVVKDIVAHFHSA